MVASDFTVAPGGWGSVQKGQQLLTVASGWRHNQPSHVLQEWAFSTTTTTTTTTTKLLSTDRKDRKENFKSVGFFCCCCCCFVVVFYLLKCTLDIQFLKLVSLTADIYIIYNRRTSCTPWCARRFFKFGYERSVRVSLSHQTSCRIWLPF